jgi:hypothetical protein
MNERVIDNDVEKNYIQSNSDDEKLIIDNILHILKIEDDRKMDYNMTYKYSSPDDDYDGDYGGEFHVSIYHDNEYTLSFIYDDDEDDYDEENAEYAYYSYALFGNIYTGAYMPLNRDDEKLATDYMVELFKLVKINNAPNNYILK